jgi:hypothetical protein
MLRLALLGLVITWCAALTRLVRTWYPPVARPVRGRLAA